MQFNFLVIIFSGISISLVGILIITLPENFRADIERNIELFLPIPPISVASYILVFKFHEKFYGQLPLFKDLFCMLLRGTLAASLFFFVITLITSLLLRIYFILLR